MELQVKLGARIRQLRKKKGLSQEQFAALCGINRSHMGEIERGEVNLTLYTMVILAQSLGTTVSALFNGIG